MQSSPWSLCEYYGQVDVGGRRGTKDAESLWQSSACGVVLRMQGNICTLSAMLQLFVEMVVKESLSGSMLSKDMHGWVVDTTR